MDFTTFKNKLTEYLPRSSYLTVGDDFSINYSILVDSEGYIHLRKNESFLRVKTSICIKDIEFRKDDWNKEAFYLIAGNDALWFYPGENIFFFYKDGEQYQDGTAFDYFTKFPV